MAKKAQTETIRIASIVKDSVRKTGERFLEVTFEVLQGKTVVDTIKQAFPIDTVPADIKSAGEAILVVRQSEASQAEVQKELDAQDEQADKTIDELVGVELK